MHQDFANELAMLADLVEQGKLPESVIPRLFLFGHELIFEKTNYPPDNKPILRCLSCFKDWPIPDNASYCPPCPHCGAEHKPYGHAVVNQVTTYKWKCTSCSHIWEAFSGITCPACGVEKNT